MDKTGRLFYLPAGVDFANELVAGLKARMAGRPPEAMARVWLFVNSRRMQQRVTAAFIASGPGFLPQMTVVSDLQADPVLADLPAPAPALRRRLELARLVGSLLKAQPDLAPMTARFDLADSLMELLREMQDEAVTPEALAALDVSGHAIHWARTQAFLRIVAPLMLGQDDTPARQRAAVGRLAAGWAANPPQDPVIVAGSTGSRGTTALLMQAVAGLATGAVVVPGFDADLPETVWAAMDDAMTVEDHPQFRFRRLMDLMGLGPRDVVPWRALAPRDPARNALISLALRPAPVTDQWLVEGPSLPDLVEATRGMTLIEAANPREEAGAIAVALREAVAAGQKAALITPDRALTRRVAAALARWDIVAEDPAGSPLALSPAGRFLRLVARGFGRPLMADHLLTVLKHPIAGAPEARGTHLAMTRALELHLRRNGPAFPTGADIVEWAEGNETAGEWAAALAKVIDQMGGVEVAPLAAHVARHRAVGEAMARGIGAEGAGQLWDEASGQAARLVMEELEAEAPHGDEMSAADYQRFFETLLREAAVRSQAAGHPNVAFFGHREAREMEADVVVLGGLTDGIWPAVADPDPWLNRRMRQDAGLLLPERQIGLSAHDFQQAVAAGRVILSRARRDAEAETVPSRWLNRLCNLMEGLPERNGGKALTAMRERGARYLRWARKLEEPDADMLADPRLQPAPRPAPQPPLAARPKKLALTRISTLIRDPYAIYAQYVLKLRPLDPLRHEPEERERGTLVHKILERFVRERPEGETVEAARRRLLAISARVMEEEVPFPSARIMWQARLERAAGHVLRQDAKHGGVPLLVEEKGQIAVTAGFTLFGTPDRIDLLPDGRLHLIDYKTGAPPSEKQQKTFDKQLILAAAMAERGGFAEVGKAEVARFTYVGLGAGEKAIETEVKAGMLDEQWARFCVLIGHYAQRATGYAARSAVFETRYAQHYDHLSRFGEWQMSERAVALRVGGDDV